MKHKYLVTSKYKASKPLKLRVVNKHIFEKDKALGQCWPTTKPRLHLIEIDPRQSPQEYLDTLIHEALHELLPKKSEKFIRRAGTTIARLLWRLGYRKSKKKRS